MEAHEQKHLQAKQNTVLFNQHHQVHMVRHHGIETTHRDAPHRQENETISLSLSLSNTSHCLPLLSAEKREEEGGGAEEERVGGPGAREDSEQITILQRGQSPSLPPLCLPFTSVNKTPGASGSFSISPQSYIYIFINLHIRGSTDDRELWLCHMLCNSELSESRALNVHDGLEQRGK